MSALVQVEPLADGIYPDMPRAAYDAIKDRANYSSLKLIDITPAHYRHGLDVGGRTDTDTLRAGRALHVAVFEPHLYDQEVITWDGGDRRGKDWKAFAALHARKEILTPAQAESVRKMAASVRSNRDAMRRLAAGEAEVTLLWTDPATGVRCKARLDWISASGAIGDLKSARDASPAAFGRQAYGLRYHAQSAFYTDGLHVLTEEELPFEFYAVENSGPNTSQVYQVGAGEIAAGRRLYRGWLQRLVECRKANHWPGYADHPLLLELPRYADRAGAEFIAPDDFDDELDDFTDDEPNDSTDDE